MEEAIRVAQQLAKSGKNPSVALVKGKLPKGYPLPKIIAALKVWQEHPELEPATASTQHKDESELDDLDQKIQRHIAQAVSLLQQEIAELRAEVDKLKNAP
ncbi:hypothetical protein [Motilimonas eburnea]|uniref:hypothetical protein n=1 Tax=Motilimonas eburnea TaxID=1737488 RepID=UPI001E2E80A1|nr:hypothetical protein [Motilimonas eburnea]MCE2569995.1 hypothetical protein [Motilimonas eburnea]